MANPTPETTKLEIRINKRGDLRLYHDGQILPTTDINIDQWGKVTITTLTRFIKVIDYDSTIKSAD